MAGISGVAGPGVEMTRVGDRWRVTRPWPPQLRPFVHSYLRLLGGGGLAVPGAAGSHRPGRRGDQPGGAVRPGPTAGGGEPGQPGDRLAGRGSGGRAPGVRPPRWPGGDPARVDPTGCLPAVRRADERVDQQGGRAPRRPWTRGRSAGGTTGGHRRLGSPFRPAGQRPVGPHRARPASRARGEPRLAPAVPRRMGRSRSAGSRPKWAGARATWSDGSPNRSAWRPRCPPGYCVSTGP